MCKYTHYICASISCGKKMYQTLTLCQNSIDNNNQECGRVQNENKKRKTEFCRDCVEEAEEIMKECGVI